MSALCWPVLLALAAPAEQAQAVTDPKPVIEQAIQAYGGEEKLAKLKAAREKSKGTVDIMGMTLEFTGTSVVQFPAQMRQEIQFEIMGQKFEIVQVYSHGKGWTKALGQIKALEGDELDDLKEEAHYARVSTLVPLLKDPAIKLSVIGEDKVDGKPVIGIKVTAKGHKDIDLYIDKASGLIIKSARMARDSTTRMEARWETFYSGFKDVGGIKYAAKVKILQDGNKFIEAEITDLELLDKVDDKQFDKPGKDA